MNPKLVIIWPNGHVQFSDRDLLVEANDRFDNQAEVWSLRNVPERFQTTAPWIGCVHEWGASNGMNLNIRAWALYGGSPIYGPMVIGVDDGSAIPEDFVEWLQSDEFGDEFMVTMEEPS